MKNSCPDCDAKIGELHMFGCDVERCPDCLGMQQLLGCNHGDLAYYEENEQDMDSIPLKNPRYVWTGLYPGVIECREMDLWAKFVPNKGFLPCSKNDPEAREDINALYMKVIGVRLK